MKIMLNGSEKELSSTSTLSDFIQAMSPQHQRIIAEINGKIVPSSEWIKTPLQEGDAVELVSFVGGG